MTTSTVPPSRPSQPEPDPYRAEQHTALQQPIPDRAADTTPPDSDSPPPDGDRYGWVRRIFWQGRIGPAFWTITGLLSLMVNVILIVVLLLLAGQLFKIKNLVGDQLIGGLYENFVKMDQAHIKTTILVSDTIQVKDTIPVVFTLPLQQKTSVVLTRDTPIRKATVFLNGVAVPTDLVLREGTKLNIYLDLEVPVNQTIPVTLNVPVRLMVPVDIPLAETELHEPFSGLQQVIGPYKALMESLPSSWAEVLCGPLPESICR